MIACGSAQADGTLGKVPTEPGWKLDLLPKAFQKNPRLDLTVITEFTAEGKKLPTVDAQHPAHYLAQSGGYRRTIGAPGNELTLPPDTIDAFIRRSLATRGYYPASGTAAATLVMVYSWGVHGRPAQDGVVSGDQLAANLLDRAALVGGEKFKQEFTALLADASAQADSATNSATQRMTVDGAAVPSVLGADQVEFMSPINRFRESSAKNEFLLEQVGGEVYYVVISCYDYAALAQNRRVLLWRTRMTVSSSGVSQIESLPTLIRVAAPYLGREMTEPATLTPRALQEGRVDLGPLIIEDDAVESPRGRNQQK